MKEAESLRNPQEAAGVKSVIAIKDNEDRARELKARRVGGREGLTKS